MRASVSTLRESLEQALVENPDDLAAHMACADYLMEQGNPLGEFIQVQLALEDESRPAAQREKLRQREKELLAAHASAWLGDVAPFALREVLPCHPGDIDQHSYRFRRGWLDLLRIGTITVNYARALVRSAQTRLLRELVVVFAAGDHQDEFEPGDDVPTWEDDHVQFFSLHPLVRSPYLGNVRLFHLGSVETADDYRQWEGSYTLGIAAADLIARMSRIEEINLWTRGVDLDKLFTLPMPHLRRLQVHHMACRHPLEKLAANASLTNLTHLMFHPHYHREFYGRDDTDPEVAYLPLSAVDALLRSPHLGKLKHLQLRVSSMGDSGVSRIAESGILGQLEVLDLRHGCVTDEGARLLARCPDTRRLRLLDLDRNHLTRRGIAALKKLGIEVRIDDQWGMGNDEFRNSYLQEGDFE
jgi:uncharacterized protein (TIGR02996 family)